MVDHQRAAIPGGDGAAVMIELCAVVDRHRRRDITRHRWCRQTKRQGQHGKVRGHHGSPAAVPAFGPVTVMQAQWPNACRVATVAPWPVGRKHNKTGA
ncbi:hypothetical protein WR25_11057 [Diploscapter pachys]|uniref:Uncharacterized protein n=1 Tax=Diploscapter pachys TaxID=2018661 RepID=A0A2A2K3K9_9BILA|nr:hypothetical protein WR25_11057 [Diploscapter pachys]